VLRSPARNRVKTTCCPEDVVAGDGGPEQGGPPPWAGAMDWGPAHGPYSEGPPLQLPAETPAAWGCIKFRVIQGGA
jgi:hypothetical protein